MANQTPIAQWLFNNRDLLDVKFVQFDWPARYCPEICDFEVSIHVNGVKAEGRGVDFDENVALEKASAEAIERYICLKLQTDSVGFAVSGRNGSLDHAKFEAIERYCFREHERLQIPLSPISVGAKCSQSARLISSFESYANIRWRAFEMKTYRPYYGFVVLVEIEGVPSVLGLGLDVDANQALKRAIFETLPNMATYCDDSNGFQSWVGNAWNSNPETIKGLMPLFSGCSDGKISAPRVTTVQIGLNEFPELQGAPISPIRALAEEAGDE